LNRRRIDQCDINYTLSGGYKAKNSIDDATKVRRLLGAIPAGSYRFNVDCYRKTAISKQYVFLLNKPKDSQQPNLIPVPEPVPAPESTPVPEPSPKPEASSLDLNWSIPFNGENGSSLVLGDIAGYEIYFIGDAVANEPIDRMIEITGALQSTYSIDGLGAGVYHLSIACIGVDGTKSPSSGLISVTLE
jgi:hypothetical protein